MNRLKIKDSDDVYEILSDFGKLNVVREILFQTAYYNKVDGLINGKLYEEYVEWQKQKKLD